MRFLNSESICSNRLVSSGSCERMSALAKKMDSSDAHDRDTFTHTYRTEQGGGRGGENLVWEVWHAVSVCLEVGGRCYAVCEDGLGRSSCLLRVCLGYPFTLWLLMVFGRTLRTSSTFPSVTCQVRTLSRKNSTATMDCSSIWWPSNDSITFFGERRRGKGCMGGWTNS